MKTPMRIKITEISADKVYMIRNLETVVGVLNTVLIKLLYYMRYQYLSWITAILTSFDLVRCHDA